MSLGVKMKRTGLALLILMSICFCAVSERKFSNVGILMVIDSSIFLTAECDEMIPCL